VDFTFTLYFVHIIVCCFYYEVSVLVVSLLHDVSRLHDRSGCVLIQFPLEWEWWLINVISSVFMASLGEYICSRNELEDIPLYAPS
jgi:hypothetical protein